MLKESQRETSGITLLPSSSSSSSSGTELPLMVESYGFLNDIFPFPSILDAGYPIFNLHLANVLFDVILPSLLVILWLEDSI